jgi:hypothetical protein
VIVHQDHSVPGSPDSLPTGQGIGDTPLYAACTCAAWMQLPTAVQQIAHPRTPVRGSPNRTPNTEHRTPTPAFPFAASRLRVSPPDSKPPPRADNLQAFQSQRTDLGRESPSYEGHHPRTPVSGSPNRTLTTLPPLAPVKRGRGVGGEGATLPQQLPVRSLKPHCKGLGLESPSYTKRTTGEPGTAVPGCRGTDAASHQHSPAPLRCPSRLRGFAASREPPPPQQTPSPRRQSPGIPVAKDRSRAGKPELRGTPPADSRPRLAKPNTEHRTPPTTPKTNNFRRVCRPAAEKTRF